MRYFILITFILSALRLGSSQGSLTSTETIFETISTTENPLNNETVITTVTSLLISPNEEEEVIAERTKNKHGKKDLIEDEEKVPIIENSMNRVVESVPPLSTDKKGSVKPRKGVDSIDTKESPTVPKKGVEEHKAGVVKGRKGVEGDDVVATTILPPRTTITAIKTTGTTTTITTTFKSTTTIVMVVEHSVDESMPKSMKPVEIFREKKVDSTPETSLLVGATFGAILLVVLALVGFKRFEAIKRRRAYRRMNDFLIDGMYNDI